MCASACACIHKSCTLLTSACYRMSGRTSKNAILECSNHSTNPDPFASQFLELLSRADLAALDNTVLTCCLLSFTDSSTLQCVPWLLSIV